METIKTHLISAIESFIAGFGVAIYLQWDNIIKFGLTINKELIFSILIGALVAAAKASAKQLRILLVDIVNYIFNYFKD